MSHKREGNEQSKSDKSITASNAKIANILNSNVGILLLGSLVGIIGLFTWQRNDWLYKKNYEKQQILIDRRIDLVERINTGLGRLLAAADTVATMRLKQTGTDQMNETIKEYNAQQAAWFADDLSHESLLGFYFPAGVSGRFREIVDQTMKLDVCVYQLAVDQKPPEEAHRISQAIRLQLRDWNELAFAALTSKDN
jgi:hypothetical protein